MLQMFALKQEKEKTQTNVQTKENEGTGKCLMKNWS